MPRSRTNLRIASIVCLTKAFYTWIARENRSIKMVRIDDDIIAGSLLLALASLPFLFPFAPLFMSHALGRPLIYIEDDWMAVYRNGVAVVRVVNSGPAPDTFGGALLHCSTGVFDGRAVNVTAPLVYYPNSTVEIPPKSEGWILIKFNVTEACSGQVRVVLRFGSGAKEIKTSVIAFDFDVNNFRKKDGVRT